MNRLRLIVLASLLLVAAPTFAQTSNGPNESRPPPATANEPSAAPANGVTWSSLSNEQRKMLSRYEGKWDSLPAERQQSLSRGSQRWLQMTPDQRKEARGRFQKWNELPPDQRSEVRNRWQQFRSLPPREQEETRENFRKFRSLPPERRKMLRDRWQNASPAERQDMLERMRERRQQNFQQHPRNLERRSRSDR